MPNEKRLSFKEMPKWFRYFFVFAPIILIVGINTTLDNDFYFLYPTGEYIVNNGFPTHDFLSMHSDMHIICQQWLSTVIFYYIYSALGRVGLIGFIYLCYFALAIIIFRLCLLITDNNQFVSALCAFAADFVMAFVYEHSRPQVITFIAIALEIYCLEKFAKTNSIKHLIPLPFISLLIINSHAAMWLMLFVFAAPYGAQALLSKTKLSKDADSFSFLKLVAIGALCFGAGFINPYSTEAMTYIFSSYGYEEISDFIIEMQPLSTKTPIFPFIAIYFAAMLVIALRVKNKSYQTRFILLFAGTLVLGVITSKSMAYFVIAGIPSFAYLIKNVDVKFNVSENENIEQNKRTRKLLIALIIIAIGALASVLVFTPKDNDENKVINNGNRYEEYTDLDKIVKILESEKGELTLYTGFSYGQYMEYKGFHPYIDGRAELFLKDNNREFDYMKELYELDNAKLYYKDFLNKYHFNYIIVSDKEDYLLTSLSHDNDYELLYNSKKVKLFKLKE